MEKVDLTTLPIEERFQVLLKAKRILCERLNRIRPNLGVITTGSVEYGYNGSYTGNLDDLDAVAIIPEDSTFEELRDSLQAPNAIFFDHPQAMSRDAFSSLITGEINVLRISGDVNGVSTSLHAILETRLRDYSTNALRNCLANKKKYYEQVYWHSIIGFPLFVLPQTDWYTFTGDASRIILEEYLLRNYSYKNNSPLLLKTTDGETRVDQSGQSGSVVKLAREYGDILIKGIIGDKILQGSLIYAPHAGLSEAFNLFWQRYLAIALKQNPQLNADDIVYAFSRSQRFSEKFKISFRKRIEERLSKLEI